MPVALLILVPLFVCALFAAGVHVLWQRNGGSAHAVSWAWAFWLAVLGWAAAGIESALAVHFVFPGGATMLCWFAAVLLAVRGVRQRGRTSDRGIELLAIWVATAVSVTMLLDIAIGEPVLVVPMALVLVAGGAMIAAVAVGPRARQAGVAVWVAMLIAIAFAIGCVALALGLLAFPGSGMALAVTTFVTVPLSVAAGLAAILALNDDRAYALERLARTDALTGVWNRRGFDEAARHLLARARHSGATSAAVAIADIDGFKGINDGHGHAVGDATLVRFAEILRNAVEPGDLLARLGGEEFAILAVGVDGAGLHQRVERVRSLLSVPSIDPKGPPTITASFGVATVDLDHHSLRDSLERADRALYRAKNDGRNRVTLAE